MIPKIDPAILEALSVDAETTKISSHGGSNFASTFKLTTKDNDGEEKVYFMKTGSGGNSALMFAGEHTSLNALHSTVPNFCPRSFAHGKLHSSPGSFLLTSFIDLSPRASFPGSPISLAQKLVQLHSTPAPIPEGFEEPQFGFPVPTCCGDTVQDNSYRTSWAEFFARSRLLHVLTQGEEKHGVDAELRALVHHIISSVVPRLLSPTHLTSPTGTPIIPVLVHGDLWSGNHSFGRIDDGEVEELVFDPASCYAHSEYEFGIMRMFGGFGEAFDREYWEGKKRDSPVEEWSDRVELYELYHHLNHYSIFGVGYRGGAMRIMRDLLRKYGKGGSADHLLHKVI